MIRPATIIVAASLLIHPPQTKAPPTGPSAFKGDSRPISCTKSTYTPLQMQMPSRWYKYKYITQYWTQIEHKTYLLHQGCIYKCKWKCIYTTIKIAATKKWIQDVWILAGEDKAHAEAKHIYSTYTNTHFNTNTIQSKAHAEAIYIFNLYKYTFQIQTIPNKAFSWKMTCFPLYQAWLTKIGYVKLDRF